MLTEQDHQRILDQAHESAVSRFGTDTGSPAARLHTMLHSAVSIARYHGHSRYAIAQRLGVSEDRVDRWVAPGETVCMPLPKFALCLLDPSVLGPQGHEWLRTRMSAAVQELGERTPAEQLAIQACEMASAAGQLAGLVADVVCPHSEDGVMVSPREQAHLEAGVAGVIDEATKLRVPEVVG